VISCLVLSRYGLLGASSRVRFGQYFEALAREGIACRLSPLLPDAYLPLRYRDDPRRYAYALIGYIERVWSLLRARAYDVVWVEGELFPGMPAFFEGLLARMGTPYVVDYDDALFHKYDHLSKGLLGGLYREKFSHLLTQSSGATAGNAYLEDLCLLNGAPAVTRVPSVVDIDHYIPQQSEPAEDRPLTIGWIGTPHTTKHLQLVEPALRRLDREFPLVLMTVGASPLEGYGVPIRQLPWSLESEVRLVNEMDIGIMPLTDEPFERGKCGYKLIQYMALAKPVVASPVGVNTEIVSPGTNGFLAKDEAGWFDALRELATSRDARIAMGAAGRTRVVDYFSVQAQVSTVARVLRAAARRGASGIAFGDTK
jgi:glycosyltransferase involved in cell wall biosynthesis